MISRFFNFVIGFLCGFVLSGGVVLLVTPQSGETFQEKVKALLTTLSAEWQQAYHERRMELEEQLVDLRRGLAK